MNLASYLHKRPQSQNWQLRVMVPKAARSVFGKGEFTRSLRTPDRRLAESLAYPILTEWLGAIQNARPMDLRALNPMPSQVACIRDLTSIAVEIGFKECSRRFDSLIQESARQGMASLAEAERRIANSRAEAGRVILAGDISAWRNMAIDSLAELGICFEAENEKHATFAFNIGRAFVDACRLAEAKAALREDEFVPSALVARVSAAEKRKARSGEQIMDLFERYARECLIEERKRSDTLAQDRKVMELFADFVGHDRTLATIEAVDVRDFRDAIAALPANYKKMNAFKGMSVREAHAKHGQTACASRSPTTVNKYLSTLSPFFGWCRRNLFATSNPCDGLFYQLPKGRNSRPPFSIEQVNKILTSPLFTGFWKPGKEQFEGTQHYDDWHFWIPLICLFTGARIGEIAQLRVEDIRQEFGVWFFHIRHDKGTGQTTKSGHSRPAPIHSLLQAIGFLEFHSRQCDRAKENANPRLFPELQPDTRDSLGAIPSRFWRKYLTNLNMKSGKDGYGAHSFRHLMADQLRLVDYLDDQIEVALGHNQKTVTGGYGRVKQGTVRFLSEMFEKVRFEGVDFGPMLAARDKPAQEAPGGSR